MKKFITVDKTGKVQLTHYMPFDAKNGMGKTEAELLQEGYLLDEIPEPEQQAGKIPVAYYTVEAGFYYQYVDAPLTPEEEMQARMQALEEQLATTLDALNTTLMKA